MSEPPPEEERRHRRGLKFRKREDYAVELFARRRPASVTSRRSIGSSSSSGGSTTRTSMRPSSTSRRASGSWRCSSSETRRAPGARSTSGSPSMHARTMRRKADEAGVNLPQAGCGKEAHLRRVGVLGRGATSRADHRANARLRGPDVAPRSPDRTTPRVCLPSGAASLLDVLERLRASRARAARSSWRGDATDRGALAAASSQSPLAANPRPDRLQSRPRATPYPYPRQPADGPSSVRRWLRLGRPGPRRPSSRRQHAMFAGAPSTRRAERARAALGARGAVRRPRRGLEEP